MIDSGTLPSTLCQVGLRGRLGERRQGGGGGIEVGARISISKQVAICCPQHRPGISLDRSLQDGQCSRHTAAELTLRGGESSLLTRCVNLCPHWRYGGESVGW